MRERIAAVPEAHEAGADHGDDRDHLPELTDLGTLTGVAAGPVAFLAEGDTAPPGGHGDSVLSGLFQAGPVAIAGLIVNGAAALLVVAIARLVSSQAYGAIAQLLGLFFILSMPGSAVLVGVVRRVTVLQRLGHEHLVRRWTARVHRVVMMAIIVEVVAVFFLQDWIARQLSLPTSDGIVLILAAAGVWILLCVDRGLLQARRCYRPLAGNLLLEGLVRSCLVVILLVAHFGVGGYALAMFISEVAATVHAHWLVSKAWADAPGFTRERSARHAVAGWLSARPSVQGEGATRADMDPVGPGGRTVDGPVAHPAPPTGDPAVNAAPANATGPRQEADAQAARRRLAADVSAAFAGLALLGVLQNLDVILLGRLDHANVGPYAAISVASKALVFGALALGAYLLPESTIRWNEGGHAVRQFGVTLIFMAVPAAILLVVSVFVPTEFLTILFSAKLSAGAPAFATLVAAMICLSVTVLMTNYLFGTGSRWIVLLLAGGASIAAVTIRNAHGQMVATARADLVAQAVLAAAMTGAFTLVHHRHRRPHGGTPVVEESERDRPVPADLPVVS